MEKTPFVKKIIAIERRLSASGSSVGALLKRSGVHKTTWSRYRNGHLKPRMDTWERIETAVEALAPKSKAA